MRDDGGSGLLARARSLFGEARRRRVISVAVAYLGLFFVLAEAASIFLPALGLEDWTLTLVVALGILAFPLVVTLAWVFDVTREGVVRAPPYRATSGRLSWRAKRPGRASASDPDLWRRVQAIFADALDQPPEARSRFVADAAGGDPSLRTEVESLLRAHDSAGALDRLASDLMEPLVAPLRTPPAMRDPPADPAPTAGRYQVLEPIANGGMGMVYRGLDSRLQREVALKFLPPHLSTGLTARRRFLVEARSAAALDHPNICTVHEIGQTEDGGLFIAMPLYDGETLDRRLARGPLPWEDAVDVAAQVAAGLARAHEAGIVHRDIKPANLCLTDQGVVKILDFGIAKVATSTGTGADAILGTAAYMSPEQARGQEVDARSDLWSLGAVLYEMLTGERLFRGEDRDAVLAGIRSSEPVPLGRLQGTAPPPVVSVVTRLLTRVPGERPPSADVVAALLRQAVESAHEADDATDEAPDLAPDGERRHATVLELLVVHYQELLERLDPAALEARLERFGRAVEGVVRRHGGTVNQFAGDRIAAVFGVPVTHEDDVLRAARAAVELHELSGGPVVPGEEPLAIAIGMSTGVLVARPADGGDRRYRLAGDPPRKAARLAGRAQAGETLLDGASRRATQGRAEPFQLTVYTGRERELETLLSSYDRSLHGEGRVVTVEGEAGAGKSRLLHEFRARVAGGPARIVHGHCEAYAGSRPYLPFLEIMIEILDLDEDPSPRDQEAAVLAAVREIDPHLEEFVPFYLHLVSAPSERFPVPRQLKGEQFRVAMREAITALITLASERAPLVLLLEDWHWVDEASSKVLKQLAEVIASYPTLVVAAYRSEHGVEWVSGQPRTLIHLSPLDIDGSARMVGSMLGVPEVPPDVGATLHERAGGNPFFLEELCHSLREAGILRLDHGRVSLSGAPASLHLPTTIQGVIRTRLDRLPSATRDVVRSAAVLGREFSFPLLERLGHDRYGLERALETLKAVGVVQQTRVVPERTFRFRHVLTQEVAYDTLLQHRRRMLHGRAGRAIQALAGGRSDEHAGRLAYHFSRAEEWREAVRFGRASAARARSLSELQEALVTLENVQEWLSRLPDDEERRELEIDTLLQQEELCETLGERGRQQEILDRLASLVDSRAGPGRLIEVSRRQGDVYTLLGRFDDARRALDRALSLARDARDPAAQGHVLRSLGLMGWHQGRADEALEHIEEALRIDREREDDEAIIADLTNKAQILKDQERYRDALDCLERAARMLEATPNDLKRSYVLHHMGTLHRVLGDSDRALEYLMKAVETSDRQHLPVQWSFHLTSIAHLHLAEGRMDEAVRTYREAVDVARRARYAEGLAQSLRPLGELLAGIGRHDEALSYLREAAELFGQLGNPEREAAVWRATAEAAEAADAYEEALQAWSRCRSLAERSGDPVHRLDALAGAARAQRGLGAVDAARSAMVESVELARRHGLRSREAATLNSLAILHWEQGSFRDAAAGYEAALEIYRALGDEVHAGLILNSLGATLRDAGRLEESRARLTEALDVNRRTGQRLLQAHALSALGDVSLESGDVDAALEHFETSRAIRREIGDRKGEGWMARASARAHARIGRTRLARRDYAAARAIAIEMQDTELLEACDAAPV